MSIQIPLVKRIDAETKLLRFAADFIERRETVVNVEHRVFETLGHDRSGELLKLQDEMDVLLARLRIQIFREPKKQNVAKEIEDRFLYRRITALGGSDRALDHLAIFVAHRLARREIGPINRKTGDCFSHRAR